MTREEREAAIAYLKGYRKLDEDLHNISPKDSISYYATDKCVKYCDMAIEALKAVPCEDAISRESVLEVVNNPLNIKLDKIIEKLPPVTPKQRKGKWIIHETTRSGHTIGIEFIECSQCHSYFLHDHLVRNSFCPNCGSDMR